MCSRRTREELNLRHLSAKVQSALLMSLIRKAAHDQVELDQIVGDITYYVAPILVVNIEYRYKKSAIGLEFMKTSTGNSHSTRSIPPLIRWWL